MEGMIKGEQIGIVKGEQIGIAKGEEIGIIKGEQIGIVKGKIERNIEMATLLRQQGVSIETIIIVTGLTREEIEKL